MSSGMQNRTGWQMVSTFWRSSCPPVYPQDIQSRFLLDVDIYQNMNSGSAIRVHIIISQDKQQCGWATLNTHAVLSFCTWSNQVVSSTYVNYLRRQNIVPEFM
jgi:hypothetical protein